MTIVKAVELRKVVSSKDVPAGIYSGRITGYVATFFRGADIYECHLMTASTKPNHPCHVIIEDNGNVLINPCS